MQESRGLEVIGDHHLSQSASDCDHVSPGWSIQIDLVRGTATYFFLHGRVDLAQLLDEGHFLLGPQALAQPRRGIVCVAKVVEQHGDHVVQILELLWPQPDIALPRGARKGENGWHNMESEDRELNAVIRHIPSLLAGRGQRPCPVRLFTKVRPEPLSRIPINADASMESVEVGSDTVVLGSTITVCLRPSLTWDPSMRRPVCWCPAWPGGSTTVGTRRPRPAAGAAPPFLETDRCPGEPFEASRGCQLLNFTGDTMSWQYGMGEFIAPGSRPLIGPTWTKPHQPSARRRIGAHAASAACQVSPEGRIRATLKLTVGSSSTSAATGATSERKRWRVLT